MTKRFVVLLFILVFIAAQEELGQTRSSQLIDRSDYLSGQPHSAQTQQPSYRPKEQSVLSELPDSVLNTELQMLEGKTLKLSDYSGKVVLLNLFATWCKPCRLESPDLAKLHREFSGRGFEVIELSTEDPEASNEAVREWVGNFRLPYAVGWAPREFALTLMQGREAIPQTFLIGRDGRLVKRFIGYATEKTLSSMREAAEEALK